jgi:PAS domain S-box-containing protein
VVGLVIAVTQAGVGQAAYYPPLAVGVALLLACGIRLWPLILASEIVIASVQYDFAVTGALISASVTTAEAVVATLLLIRLRFRWSLERVDDVVILGGVAAAVAALGATAGSLLLRATDQLDVALGDAWWVWFIGETTGLALLLPALHLIADPTALRRESGSGQRRRAAELVVFATGSLACITLFFWNVPPEDIGTEQAGLLLIAFLPALWIALRFGVAVTAIIVVSFNVIAALAYGDLGPHAGGDIEITGSFLAATELALLGIGLASLGVAAAVEAEQLARRREMAIRDASPLPIISIDTLGRVRTWSAAAENVFGWTSDEVNERTLPIIAPEHLAAFRERMTSELDGPVEGVQQYVRADGTHLFGRVFTAPIRDDHGVAIGVMGIVQDVTASKGRDDRLHLLEAAIDQASEAVMITDPHGTTMYVNPALERSSGYSAHELLGRNPRILRSEAHDDAFFDAMWTQLRARQTWTGTVTNRRKNGELFEEETTITPVVDDDAELIAYVAIKRDLSRERALETDLWRSHLDRETMRSIMSRVHLDGAPGDVISQLCHTIVELSDFDAADVLAAESDGTLVPLAVVGTQVSIVRQGVRLDSQWAAQMDERTRAGAWWINWLDAPAEALDSVPEIVAAGIRTTAHIPIHAGDDYFGMLIVASRADDSIDWMDDRVPMLTELAAFAGSLMRATGADDEQAAALRTEIAAVIRTTAMHIAYQPVVSLANGAVWGVEALTRFDDGSRPDERFAQAWRVGLGPELELACARLAIRDADRLPEGACLSINLSPQVIVSGDAMTLVRSCSRALALEVTEHVPIDDYAELRRALLECGPAHVAVDDAGAGYASLRHILELQPDVVKLDIGLVRNIDSDPARQAIVAGLVHYAQTAGLQLIGEGVETEAERDTLRHLGVPLGQGYLFGRPAPLD